jgi:hypothetical protein
LFRFLLPIPNSEFGCYNLIYNNNDLEKDH